MGDSSMHAELSPSKRHRWAACPGSIREEQNYPEPPTGHAALDGTRTHALLEHAINFEFRDRLGVVDPRRYLGQQQDEHGTYMADEDRIARLGVALEYIRSRVGAFPPIAESRVYPDGFVGRADMSGTVDVQIPGKDVYEIIDYKDGMSVVSAEGNPQLRQYALGVLARFKLQPWETFPFNEMWLTIVQPRLALKGMPPISTWKVKVMDILMDVPKIQAEAAATDDPDAPLNPGDKQCKWCPAKGTCAALATESMGRVGMMFQPVSLVPAATQVMNPLDLSSQAVNNNPEGMSDDQIRQILEAKPLLEQMLKGVAEEAERRLKSGRPVPGFKLVEGRGSRSWTLPEEENAKKLVGMKIPKSAIYKTDLVSVAEAEKLTWDAKDGTKVRLTDEQIKRMNQNYVSKSKGKLTVVPESDPREAVITDVSSMFAPVIPTFDPNSVPEWMRPKS
jgi:hypothetical protein